MNGAFGSLREALRSVRDRPLLLGPSLRDIYPDDLAVALRRGAALVVGLQRSIVDAGAELVIAPTAGTTAPALHATGQAYRAAALTAAAVDLTRDAVLATGRAAAVLGEVPALPGARARSEARTHVERLATSAIDGILVAVGDEATTRDILDAAREHQLPALIEIEASRPGDLSSLGAASVIVLCGDDPETIAAGVSDLRARFPSTPLGARIVAPAHDAQLAIARAWGVLAELSLALIGVSGNNALDALPALVDLSRAPRASLPG